MDSQIFLGGSEPTTMKELSEALGKETIDSFNTSDTRGNSPSYGTSFQKLGHELMSRDELAVLDGGKCILQLRGVRPFLSEKYDLTQHPNYKLTADYDPKNTFDIEKYLHPKIKIHPNDAFVVVDADSLPPVSQLPPQFAVSIRGFRCVRMVCKVLIIKEKRLWNSLTLLWKFCRLWWWL